MVKIITEYPITKEYELLNIMGQGTYAQVYRGRDLKSGNIRAIKKIDRSKHPKISSMLVNEFDILRECVIFSLL